MLTMTKITQRQMKRYHIDNEVNVIKNEFLDQNWSIQKRKKLKNFDQNEYEYYCYVYMKLFPSTLKCSIDVIVKSNNQLIDDNDSILIAKSRIPKIIQPGVIRVRLVSSLFTADVDVQEDPSLIKLQTIKTNSLYNQFDKQFALLLKNTKIGPGTIGKLYIESLDPSNGSYTNNPPIFELNLNLTSEHEILLTSSHQNNDNHGNVFPLECGCILSSNSNHLIINDKCNLILSDMKLIHRLSEPLRCLWKSIGRELSSCFSEIDLMEIDQRYYLSDGNYECTYQLLRKWYNCQPDQANIRYLLTKLKLPFQTIQIIHNDIIKTFI